MIATIWVRRKGIALAGLIGATGAAFWGFVLASPQYESSALLLPTQGSITGDQLSTAAALLGKKTGAAGDVDLYQSLLTSRTVLRRLLPSLIANDDDTGRGRMEPLYHILQIDTSSPTKVEGAIKDLSKSILVGTRESGEGGILEIRFLANSPWLARALGNKVLEIGQDELRQVRARRAALVGAQLARAVEASRLEWDTTTRRVAAFQDFNRSIILPEQRLQLARLQTEQTAKEQRYLLGRRELEVQSLEIAKAAPPMMVLDSANLPVYRSSPKRTLATLAGGVVGVVLGILWALGSTAARQAGLFQELKRKVNELA
jgi:uncharacterized protein involved in exopolysaccharide biosynthesis